MSTTRIAVRRTSAAGRWNPALLIVSVLLVGSAGQAAETSTVTLTPQEQQAADAFDKTKLLAGKEADALAAQNALTKAKVASATPVTGEGVVAPSGSAAGANSMTFAMYMLSIDSLRQVAQAVCNDLEQRGIRQAFTSDKDVAEAVAKDEAFRRARDQLAGKLRSATAQARQMRAAINGTAGSEEGVSAASLATVASGIDVATGLTKGAAGLTSLFKSDRSIQSGDNLLTEHEVSFALSMCVADASKQAAGPPRLINVDVDLSALAADVAIVSNEVNDISNLAAGLDAVLNDLGAAAGAPDARRPINYSAFVSKAGTLVTSAQAYVDSMFQVDATSGLSPVIVASKFRALRNAATASGAPNRLVLSLLRSSGYSLTTKQLFLSDRVDYAGGVAIHASVVDSTGVAVYDRVLYRDSGWIRADLAPTAVAPARQNF